MLKEDCTSELRVHLARSLPLPSSVDRPRIDLIVFVVNLHSKYSLRNVEESLHHVDATFFLGKAAFLATGAGRESHCSVHRNTIVKLAHTYRSPLFFCDLEPQAPQGLDLTASHLLTRRGPHRCVCRGSSGLRQALWIHAGHRARQVTSRYWPLPFSWLLCRSLGLVCSSLDILGESLSPPSLCSEVSASLPGPPPPRPSLPPFPPEIVSPALPSPLPTVRFHHLGFVPVVSPECRTVPGT
ncbi:centromere protein M isoform X2 [Felis catus]|nr:centromere protein M isoform X2 [Felis catus]XP_044918386.1 centromere protein M isoform X2 [Felis catus]XP_044918387.1 centromere protein M isoform X2 [Felis catus]